MKMEKVKQNGRCDSSNSELEMKMVKVKQNALLGNETKI